MALNTSFYQIDAELQALLENLWGEHEAAFYLLVYLCPVHAPFFVLSPCLKKPVRNWTAPLGGEFTGVFRPEGAQHISPGHRPG